MSLIRIKSEKSCLCCSSDESHLYCIIEPHNCDGKVEIYSNMISECFGLNVGSNIEETYKNLYMICDECVNRLKEAFQFRYEVESAFNRIQGLINKSTNECKFKVEEIKVEFSKTRTNSSQDENSEDENEYISNLTMDSCTSNNTDSYQNNLVDPISERNILLEEQTAKKKSDDSYVQHYELIENAHTCLLCGKNYSSKKACLLHVKAHFGIYKIKCPLCPERFKSDTGRDLHLLNIHNKERKKYDCGICGREFYYSNQLKRHVDKTHINKRRFHCEDCGKSYLTKADLLTHMKVHNDTKDFACFICKKVFFYKKYLNKHMKRHSENNSRKCTLCSETFTNPHLKMKHMLTAHNIEQKIFNCEYCSKNYSNISHLRSHMNVMHLKIKKYICDICNKTFYRKCIIEEHMIVHSGIKGYHCKLCDKSYTRRQGLLRHMKIHHNSRLRCTICDKPFTLMKHLKIHMKTHEDYNELQIT